MLNDCHKAVGNDDCVDLDIYSVRAIAPEVLHSEMLLDEFEEKFHRPSILVEKGNTFGGKIEIISVVSERPLKLINVEDDTPYYSWVVAFIALRCEPYSLASENAIITVEHVLPLHDLILWLPLLPNDKERIKSLNFKEPRQIPVSTIKDIAGKRLIVNPVHRIHIINRSLGNGEHHRYDGYNIYLGVYLDACHAALESCPVKDGQTETNSSGVEGVILAVKLERLALTLPLSYRHHVIRHLLKDMVIPLVVRIGESCSFDRRTAEAEMVRLARMGSGDVREFPKTAATIKLAKHKNQQLVPVRQAPRFGLVITLGNKPLKVSLGEKIYHLTKDISAAIHLYAHFYTPCKGGHFKCATRFFDKKILTVR